MTYLNFQTYFQDFYIPCLHGFFNRGNLTNPEVADCVSTAYGQMMELFALYV